MSEKLPAIPTEKQEAEWRAANQNRIAERSKQAKADGKLARGTPAIRLAETDIV